MKEQAFTATTTTYPLFMTPSTREQLKNEIKKLFSDKSPGPSGITNRMLRKEGPNGFSVIHPSP